MILEERSARKAEKIFVAGTWALDAEKMKSEKGLIIAFDSEKGRGEKASNVRA